MLRSTLGLIVASLGLAGIAGCSTKPAPAEKIFPYVRQPEQMVPGKPLSREIYEQGTINIERALRIIEQVCEGVEAAHNQQVVHCDLKPDNILLERLGSNRELVQLVDFGIARLRELTGGGSLSSITDSAIGTPHTDTLITVLYMYPILRLPHHCGLLEQRCNVRSGTARRRQSSGQARTDRPA